MTAPSTPPAPPATGAPAPGSPGPWDERSRALLSARPPASPAAPASPATPAPTPASKPAPRRGPADPVKALMHRHRALCERAVDPLEIAAGLEAHGITDRTAARFRHRDVFSLAEELYARVPHGTDSGAHGAALGAYDATLGAYASHSGAHAPTYAPVYAATHTPHAAPGREPAPAPAGSEHAPGPGRSRPATGRARWTALALLPGAVAATTLVALDHSTGQSRLAIGLAGALTLSGVLSACLRRGPLRARGRRVPAAGLWTYWLLGYLLCGDGLLAALVAGGPHGPWPAPLTPVAALTLAVAPAAWCAHLFSVQARRRLSGSRGLADFAAGARPLLLSLVGLYALAVTGLSLLATRTLGDGGDGALAPTVALATLFLLARLLTVHGFPDAAATGLAAACAAEALACAATLAGRIPGCDALAAPVRAVVLNGGPAAVSTLACGAAALALLGHAAVVLSRASAHTEPGGPPHPPRPPHL
ncbi:hypothetical protein [Streptomyces corynorhini]|uniref:hypothetical protein n=1 Tax=Streptomyces corynorhini TaxID=2282652 RepID=UPI001F1DD352|nr:hypothetical protein [Streptomyces corynorhini]